MGLIIGIVGSDNRFDEFNTAIIRGLELDARVLELVVLAACA